MKTFILLSVLNWKKVINESNMDHRTKEFTYVYIIVDLPEPSCLHHVFRCILTLKGFIVRLATAQDDNAFTFFFFFFTRLFENIG